MTWFIASLRAIKIIKYDMTNFVSQARTLEVQKQLQEIISGQHFSLWELPKQYMFSYEHIASGFTP